MTKLSEHWQEYYMGLAYKVAEGSKDGSSKVGAVLVRPDKTLASIGFNGFPARIKDREDVLKDPNLRHLKYPRMVHAEANCLNYSRDRGSDGYHLFVTMHPCDKCSLRLASTGIEHVYFATNEDYENRWAENIEIAKEILGEAGIKTARVDVAANQVDDELVDALLHIAAYAGGGGDAGHLGRVALDALNKHSLMRR